MTRNSKSLQGIKHPRAIVCLEPGCRIISQSLPALSFCTFCTFLQTSSAPDTALLQNCLLHLLYRD
jgi:hypothetical protein